MASGTVKSLLNTIYRVGEIYMSVNSTDPGTLFGGTWERITGRFLLAATDGGSSGASQAAGNTGGEATHKLTVSEMPDHVHSIRFKNAWTATGTGSGNWLNNTAYTWGDNTQYRDIEGMVNGEGGNGAHNNMPPYLAVYVWKRTA